jgi:hypothetical protein
LGSRRREPAEFGPDHYRQPASRAAVDRADPLAAMRKFYQNVLYVPDLWRGSLNGVDPQAWHANTLEKLVNLLPAARIDELLPWAYPRSKA